MCVGMGKPLFYIYNSRRQGESCTEVGMGNDLSNPSSTVLANEEKATHYLCVFMLPTATLLGLLLPKGGLWIFKMRDSLSAYCARKCMAGSDESAQVLEELKKHPSPCLIQEWYSGHWIYSPTR